MENLNIRIGNELQKVRASKDLSLRDVAKLVGKSYSTIYAYETGVNAMNIQDMKELCDIYNVNYIDILQKIYDEDMAKKHKGSVATHGNLQNR